MGAFVSKIKSGKKRYFRSGMVFDIKKYIRRSSNDFQLWELQMEVLERSKEISQLQSRLSGLLDQHPESVVALGDLKKVIEGVNLCQKSKSVSEYGPYGKRVVDIARTTVDSVRQLTDKVPDSVCQISKDKVCRSLSENAASINRQRKESSLDKIFRNRTRSCTTNLNKTGNSSSNTINKTGNFSSNTLNKTGNSSSNTLSKSGNSSSNTLDRFAHSSSESHSKSRKYPPETQTNNHEEKSLSRIPLSKQNSCPMKPLRTMNNSAASKHPTSSKSNNPTSSKSNNPAPKSNSFPRQTFSDYQQFPREGSEEEHSLDILSNLDMDDMIQFIEEDGWLFRTGHV